MFSLSKNPHLKGCLYEGELARLGGLAHLGDISPSLRNSYKNMMCSYEKLTSPRLGGISLDFTWIPLRCDENFPYEHAHLANPARWDRVFLMRMYMICFGIVSKFNFNIAMSNTTMTSAKK